MKTLIRLAPLFALVCGLVGCDGSPSPAMGDYVDVSGTVTLPDGQPMKSGTIHFEPDGVGRDEFTQVKDGAFSLKMFAGKYKVAFDVGSKKPVAPAKFTKFASSGLTTEVKSGGQPLALSMK